MPSFKQLFVSDPAGATGIELDRKAFVARKRSSRANSTGELETYFASLSARTIVYKGMFTTPQLSAFYPDLLDPRVESALLIVHSRFSTNTFPSWALAHPYRFVAHNGEINTVQGNQNWMRAREAMLRADLLPGIERTYPICTPGASDTARFDEVLEVLCLGGYPIHHAMLMMIPEAWENHETMPQAQRDFYRFHATMMEPWDGPASVAFTDGDVIGAVLDRNGLRPSRYWVTDDDVVVMASEVGVIDIDPSRVVAKGRLQPGKMFLIDTRQGRIVADDEIKSELASLHPYGEWLEAGMVELADLPDREHVVFSHDSVLRRQQMFGYTHEELKILLTPMAATGGEALGSMGTDTPLAVLSERPRLLFDYFKQLFAQVTNPPLDAIREEVVTAVSSSVGPEANLLGARSGELSSAGAAVPDHRQRRARQDHPHQRRGQPPRSAGQGALGSVPRRRRRRRPAHRARRSVPAGLGGHRERCSHHRAVGPQRRQCRRPDPVTAAHRGGPPPSGAHQAAHDGRADRRVG